MLREGVEVRVLNLSGSVVCTLAVDASKTTGGELKQRLAQDMSGTVAAHIRWCGVRKLDDPRAHKRVHRRIVHPFFFCGKHNSTAIRKRHDVIPARPYQGSWSGSMRSTMVGRHIL